MFCETNLRSINYYARFGAVGRVANLAMGQQHECGDCWKPHLLSTFGPDTVRAPYTPVPSPTSG